MHERDIDPLKAVENLVAREELRLEQKQQTLLSKNEILELLSKVQSDPFDISQSTPDFLEISKKEMVSEKSDQTIRKESVDEFKAELKKEMLAQERNKYPNPPYEYRQTEISHQGREMVATYIRYNGSDLTKENFEQMRKSAVILRKFSILAGVFNALTFSQNYLTANQIQRNNIEALIRSLYKKVIDDQKSAIIGVDPFIVNLVDEISKITNEDNTAVILRQVRNAERYFVAEYRRNHILVAKTQDNNDTLVQVDIPFGNALTFDQKKEFVSIYDDEKLRPKWFNRLPQWEQDWFLQHVPKKITDDWTSFTSLFKSSAMIHIPGICNARTNYSLQKKEGEDYDFVASFKTGTLVPYEMPATNRSQETKENADQLLSYLANCARTNFETAWGDLKIAFPEDIKPPLFISGLLSDAKVFGTLDKHLKQGQAEAIKNVEKNFQDLNIITGNDAVNVLRHFSPDDWQHTNQIMKNARNMNNFLLSLRKQGLIKLTPQQYKRLDLMKKVYKELRYIRGDILDSQDDFAPTITLNRNSMAYKVAYTSILVEEMGGMVSTNCKSGKDRTGLDEIYRAAIRHYYKKYGTLPGFYAQDKERKKFIKVFIPIYKNMKAQEAAAGNTPGSLGLKDDARMLCGDIADALEESYKYSNALANMNKTSSLKQDESEARKEAKKKDKKDAAEAKEHAAMTSPVQRNLMADIEILNDKIRQQKIFLEENMGGMKRNKRNKAEKFLEILDDLEAEVLALLLGGTPSTPLELSFQNLEQDYKDALKAYQNNPVKNFFSKFQRFFNSSSSMKRYGDPFDKSESPTDSSLVRQHKNSTEACSEVKDKSHIVNDKTDRMIKGSKNIPN